MSQENVELVRRAFAAYAHGGAQALVQYATSACASYPDPSWIEDGVYRGRDAFIAFDKTQTDTFGDFTVEVRDIRAVGERVLVLAETVGQATRSGIPVRQQAAHVLSDFLDGMIGEDRTFLSWEAGLKAVGLEK
jgi:ketosteroid isomerase-like protein